MANGLNVALPASSAHNFRQIAVSELNASMPRPSPRRRNRFPGHSAAAPNCQQDAIRASARPSARRPARRETQRRRAEQRQRHDFQPYTSIPSSSAPAEESIISGRPVTAQWARHLRQHHRRQRHRAAASAAPGCIDHRRCVAEQPLQRQQQANGAATG